MRVAIVSESFLPAVNGVTRSVERVVDHLLARGHTPLVVAPGRSAPRRHGDVEVVRLPSVPLPLCPDLLVGLPWPGLRGVLEDFAPDVVHLASPALVGAQAARVCRDLGLPTVAVFQTDLAGFATQYGMGRASDLLWRWLRRLHDEVDLTLAPSRPTVHQLRRRGFPRVQRWGRGVDGEQFHPRRRTRPPTDTVGRVRIGYVGRLAAEKHVERLAHVTGLAGTTLHVVGDGARRRRLERVLPDAVFTGHLGGAALGRAYADLDVFVHTGETETFCQTVQEALASGVPVVAPAAGGPLDLVEHGVNGLLWRADRPADIRQLVAALVDDPTGRAAMGIAAHEGVRHRTWAAVGDELVAHYRAVVASATRRQDRAVPVGA